LFFPNIIVKWILSGNIFSDYFYAKIIHFCHLRILKVKDSQPGDVTQWIRPCV
jgi:hypothetical protein